MELAEELAGPAAPFVLDATHLLHRPEQDGDHRSESGRGTWTAKRVPGSRHVEIATEFSDAGAALHYAHPSPQAIVDRLAALGIGPTSPVVVTDAAGGLWAARLWYLLDWIGHPVRVLDGGLRDWEAAGLPIERGESVSREPIAVEPWAAAPRRPAWIERGELEAGLGTESLPPLVCGLSRGLYEGTETTRYARRGRIPGSLSIPARRLVDEDGRLLPPELLRAVHREAGLDLDASEILLYCGGGISASFNALALAALGVDRVRVYDGSLEEWAADPALPLVVGAVA